MFIASLRLTHHKTPNEFFHDIYGYYRENKEKVHKDLTWLKNTFQIDGLFLLSTCHRFELYVSKFKQENENNPLAICTSIQILEKIFCHRFANYQQYMEISLTDDSLKHLLSVTVGIDSIIIGEVDIIEQVQESYFYSKQYDNTDGYLDYFIEYAINFGRSMRQKTKIERGITSYASIPYELTKKLIKDDKTKIFIIGAGMLGRRVVINFTQNYINNIIIANRSYDKAKSLAKQFGIKALSFSRIKHHLKGDEIIICCSAGGVIEPLKYLKEIKNKKFYIFDFGVPKNIPKEIREIKEITYISMENCKKIIADDGKKKKKEKSYLKNYIHEEIKHLFRQADIRFALLNTTNSAQGGKLWYKV